MRGRFHSPLLGGALLLCTSGAAAAPSFEMEVLDASPPEHPWMKAIGDLDGDGRLDLVIAGRNGPLVWYENPGWTKRTIATNTGTGGSTTGIAIGDLDGNGSPDVVLANGVWFANPRPAGDAKTDAWERRDIDATKAHDVWLSDLDGDHDLDVVKRDQMATGDVIRIFRQGSGGQWTERSLTAEAGEGLALGDLDRDGDDDIVIRGRWYENDGNPIGGSWSEHPYTTAYTHPHLVVRVADVNGDHRLDIVLSPSEPAGGRYRISWFEAPPNAKSPDWTEHVLDPDVETVVHALVIADFDRDGRSDVALAEMHQGADPDRVRVLFQKSAGAFTNEDIWDEGSHALAAGDLDGDGRPELFGANWNSAEAPDGAPARIWWNRTTGGGGGGGGGGSPDALCAKRILRSAGLRCRRVLKCYARAVGSDSSEAAPCLATAEASLDEALAALPEKAPECSDEAAAATEAAPAARTAGEALVMDLLAATDNSTKPARKLHATLLRLAGGLCGDLHDAYGKDAKAPAPADLADALGHAREKFLAKSGKALDRGAEKGVAYGGPLPTALADTIDGLVADFVAALTPDESF